MMTDGKIETQNIYIAISGCRSLSQSPENSSFELDVVENLRFVFGISVVCVIWFQRYISGFGGHIAISGYRSLSQSLGHTLVENAGFVVGIS